MGFNDGYRVSASACSGCRDHLDALRNHARIACLHDDLHRHLDPLTQYPQGLRHYVSRIHSLVLLHERCFDTAGEYRAGEDLHAERLQLAPCGRRELVLIRAGVSRILGHRNQVDGRPLELPREAKGCFSAGRGDDNMGASLVYMTGNDFQAPLGVSFPGLLEVFDLADLPLSSLKCRATMAAEATQVEGQ